MAYIKNIWLNKNSEGAIPISAKNLSHMEDGIFANSEAISELEQRYEGLKEGEIFDWLKGDVVWTNDAPDSDFIAQSVSVDLSQYVRFSILFKENKNADTYVEYQTTLKDKSVYFDVNTTYSSSYIYGRYITLTDNKITFSSTWRGSSANSTYNNLAIPVRIIGYKY